MLEQFDGNVLILDESNFFQINKNKFFRKRNAKVKKYFGFLFNEFNSLGNLEPSKLPEFIDFNILYFFDEQNNRIE